MAFNFDHIMEKYNAVASGTSNAWEVYSGEQADAMAEENKIPTQKWLHDCAAMQAGQQTVAEELAKGVPQTAQEREARLRGLISRQISGLLRGQSDDVARRGVLLHALQAASDFQLDDDRVAELSRLDLDALRNKVVDAAMDLTKNIALPVMQQKFQEAAQTVPEPEQQTQVLDNPGALAVAEYMEEPELRHMPVVLGACAGIVGCCAAGGSEINLKDFAFSCLITAAILVCFCLMLPGILSIPLVAGNVVATVITNGTLAGIGALIVENLSLIASNYLIPFILGALGLTVISKLKPLLDEFADENPCSYVGPIHYDTGPIVSA